MLIEAGENPWPPALIVTALLNLLGPHAVGVVGKFAV